VLVALVATVGALAIHWLRRGRAPAYRDADEAARIAEPAPSLPQDEAIAGRLRELAARMGLPERVLPRAHEPTGDGDFVWREGDQYRYQGIERGGPIADHSDPSLDEILFLVFRDRCWMHAYLATIGMDEPARGAEVASRQRAMLAAAEPEWAARLEAKHDG
jgi:hypothetical protein